ncbi:hypothetical protein ISN45_At01g014780 [Arabidopsis thaliana x Arabidopsis arenosa]|jgi:hypothetical protein|uniref:Uncharacterized protein n=1 Tax=Arabidopsis thaliana x Arabidopsis arenosa TaxID=1240361 RepID=A0A8T2GCG7_9BRAS|nr:hypothetical protein ISN45_At01g014780 [Arabidopsis thaliana x Arabidopsis arenosa]
MTLLRTCPLFGTRQASLSPISLSQPGLCRFGFSTRDDDVSLQAGTADVRVYSEEELGELKEPRENSQDALARSYIFVPIANSFIIWEFIYFWDLDLFCI